MFVFANNPGHYGKSGDSRSRQAQISDDFYAKLCSFVQVRYRNSVEINTAFSKKLPLSGTFVSCHFSGINRRGAMLPGRFRD